MATLRIMTTRCCQSEQVSGKEYLPNMRQSRVGRVGAKKLADNAAMLAKPPS